MHDGLYVHRRLLLESPRSNVKSRGSLDELVRFWETTLHCNMRLSLWSVVGKSSNVLIVGMLIMWTLLHAFDVLCLRTQNTGPRQPASLTAAPFDRITFASRLCTTAMMASLIKRNQSIMSIPSSSPSSQLILFVSSLSNLHVFADTDAAFVITLSAILSVKPAFCPFQHSTRPLLLWFLVFFSVIGLLISSSHQPLLSTLFISLQSLPTIHLIRTIASSLSSHSHHSPDVFFFFLFFFAFRNSSS